MSKQDRTPPGSGQLILDRVSNFDAISSPGSWMCEQTGTLYRVPSDALKPGHSPIVNIVSRQERTFVQLSTDDTAPIGKLRQIAANSDLQPNF